jgi:hypothetical protein
MMSPCNLERFTKQKNGRSALSRHIIYAMRATPKKQRNTHEIKIGRPSESIEDY